MLINFELWEKDRLIETRQLVYRDELDEGREEIAGEWLISPERYFTITINGKKIQTIGYGDPILTFADEDRLKSSLAKTLGRQPRSDEWDDARREMTFPPDCIDEFVTRDSLARFLGIDLLKGTISY